MAKRSLMGVQDVRKNLATRIDAAATEGIHTVVAKRGEPIAVLVPIDWYRRVSAADGDPTEF